MVYMVRRQRGIWEHDNLSITWKSVDCFDWTCVVIHMSMLRYVKNALNAAGVRMPDKVFAFTLLDYDFEWHVESINLSIRQARAYVFWEDAFRYPHKAVFPTIDAAMQELIGQFYFLSHTRSSSSSLQNSSGRTCRQIQSKHTS